MLRSILRMRLLRIDVGPYRFDPGVITTIVTAALLYLMLFLAQWQAGKADYKENLQRLIAERQTLEHRSIGDITGSVDDRLYMPVSAYGDMYDRYHILHDNRILNGRVGYDVYVPLQRDNGEVVMVNYGFLPQGANRQDLPELDTPIGKHTIEGVLSKPPSKGVVLAEGVNSYEHWPAVVQYIDLQQIAGALGAPVYDMVLWMDEQTDDGYAREIPAVRLDAAKNSGYAFQWYAMSVALTAIYLYMNIRRRDRDDE